MKDCFGSTVVQCCYVAVSELTETPTVNYTQAKTVIIHNYYEMTEIRVH
jgi:hypothetical protein